MAFISPDVAVALVRATLAICGDRATGVSGSTGGTMGSSPSSPPQAKRESDTVVNNIYRCLYCSFICHPVLLFATRSDCYYTGFVFRVSCFVVETGHAPSLQP